MNEEKLNYKSKNEEVLNAIEQLNPAIVGLTFFRHAERSSGYTGGADQTVVDEPSSLNNYYDLTECGIADTKIKAENYAREVIDKLPAGSLVLAVGASDMLRTAGTLNVIADSLKSIYEGSDSVAVLTQKDILDLFDKDFVEASEQKHVAGRESFEYHRSQISPEKISAVLKKIAEFVALNKDKKVVISYPIWLKGLTYGKHWGYWDALGLFSATPDMFLYEVFENTGHSRQESERLMYDEWKRYEAGQESMLKTEYPNWAINKLQAQREKLDEVKDKKTVDKIDEDLEKLKEGKLDDFIYTSDGIFQDYINSANRAVDFLASHVDIATRPVEFCAVTHRLDVDIVNESYKRAKGEQAGESLLANSDWFHINRDIRN